MVVVLIAALGNEHESQQMLCGTFHSIALKILRADGAAIGYSPDTMTVAGPDDADMLLEQVCRELGYFDGEKWRGGTSWKQIRREREDFYTTGTYTGEPDLELIIGTYRRRLFEMNCLDFGTILTECQRLLEWQADVRSRWNARVKHVLEWC